MYLPKDKKLLSIAQKNPINLRTQPKLGPEQTVKPQRGLGMMCVLVVGSILSAEPAIASEADIALEGLFAREWAYRLQQHPEFASSSGDLRYNQSWTDFRLRTLAKHDAHNTQVIDELAEITVEELSAANQINYAIFFRQRKEQQESYKLGLHLMPINMRDGVQNLFDAVSAFPLNTKAHYQDWLHRLEGVDDILNQTEVLLQEGIKRGLTQPKIIMQRVVEQLDKIIVNDPIDSPFYQVFMDMPAHILDTDKLKVKAKVVISEQITPAYKKFRRFFKDKYLPACREAPGIYSARNGAVIYDFVARTFTTTSLSPQEIHQIGLDEVARIRGEMKTLIKKIGFKGSLEDFIKWLRTDPQFYYKTPEALFNGYLAVAKRIDPELVSLFGKLPRTPYGVKAIPNEIAPNTTTAYYMPLATDGSRAGYYYVNLYKPESRPKWEMEVLSTHEAVPGHHLQIALAAELEGVPIFRKHSSFTAYVEGWALYSEGLGYQMGLYKDPYSQFGQLTYDMWRAVRLVVDTGIHAFGWSRQRAIEYFAENAPKTKQDIVNEIDRYIGWPGQALAYKIGQLKILEIRKKAEQTLGDNFDIREFHDQLLSTGAVPLDVLETHMEAWLNKTVTKSKSSQ